MDKKILEITKNYKSKLIDISDSKKTWSSGSLIIDSLTGIGGYPQSRIIEIFGQPSTGKTTLSVYAIKTFQSKFPDKKCVFLDIERTLNPEYAKMCGVNLAKTIIIRPKNAEETFNLIIDFIKTELIGLIVVDSVAALLPAQEQSNKMEDNTIGLHARVMSKAMRKINYLLTEYNANIIFTNQMRQKINKFFGNPETTTGGNALKFYASLRIQLKRKSKLLINKNEVGFISKIRIIKNKLARAFTENEIYFWYDIGINNEYEIIQLSIQQKIIIKKGNWFWYNNDKLGLGFQKTIEFLINNPKIKQKILTTLNF